MVEINRNVAAEPGRYDMACYAFSFLCGILAASLILPGVIIMLGSFLLSAAALFINRKSRASQKAAFLLVVFLSGMLDYSVAVSTASKLDLAGVESPVYECVILGNPVEKGAFLQYPAKCTALVYGGKRFNFSEEVFLKINKSDPFSFGNKVSVTGTSTDITGRRNPGDFDFRLYYKSKGINKTITADSVQLLEKNSGGIFSKLLYLSKEKVKSIINQALPSEEAAILTGIIIGDKADIDEDTRDAYMKTGLSHILSVSGLHVGFLMLLLTGALKPFKLDNKLQGIIILALITYYILLIGAPLPSVRALLMLAVYLLGKAAGRDYDLLASVSFAFLLMLIFKPLAVHDPGFMISFAAMYAIVFLYPAVYGRLCFIPVLARNAVALSLAVWLGLSPVLACYFNYISLSSIIINVIAVPISLAITIAGFIGVFAGIISQLLSIYIFSVDYYLIRLLNYIITTAAGLPMTGVYIPSLPIYIHALYYAGLGIWLGIERLAFFKAYRSRLLMAYALAAALALSVYSLPSGELKLVYFDVGQGDSCLVLTPGKKALLIDGGGSVSKGEYYYDVGGKITVPALLHQGVWSIDTVMASHLHDDHMEGLIKVLEVYRVKNLIVPRVYGSEGSVSPNSSRLFELCAQKGIKVYRLGRGDSMDLGSGTRIQFLHPGREAEADENENSLVALLTYGSFSALFTGDIGRETEAGLPAELLESDLLKVPHHGSRGSSSEEFLEAVKPRISVIPVGRNNYGHPSEETLKRLEGIGSLIYRTDEAGAVTVLTDGKRVKVKTVR